jgi:hypothetical protein
MFPYPGRSERKRILENIHVKPKSRENMTAVSGTSDEPTAEGKAEDE